MRHLLIGPAFAGLAGTPAKPLIDDKARVWTVTRGADGRLVEQLDPALLAGLDDAVVSALGAQEIAETRFW
jgi:hypothetical protein